LRKPASAKKLDTMPQRKSDPRARRTRERLGGALIELIVEKPIGAITVQEVLDRANVGRSTFYVHYSDKNDLLFSQLEMFLNFMTTRLSTLREESQRVVAVAEMFEHIGDRNRIYQALVEAGKLQDFYNLAQDAFARGIARRLRETGRAAGLSRTELAARSTILAGSLLALLRWWIDRGAKESPKAMDTLFHRMVCEGIK
jgi:AcrR family transcriptional regulator